jgi:hypothetical protein
LCIVQDSSEDWKKEAQRMAIIYDNAVFTIAAVDAKDSSQGLFPPTGDWIGDLETRAWTYQERMIAPRTLLFTHHSVAWECRQGSANPDSDAFEEDADGTVIGSNKADWIPPTHPKAIFAFFRDWRLPPQDSGEANAERESSPERGMVSRTNYSTPTHSQITGSQQDNCFHDAVK